jgi:hypothetical protein
VFAEMDNKSVSVNGSRCLISYVNVVVLIICVNVAETDNKSVSYVNVVVLM